METIIWCLKTPKCTANNNSKHMTKVTVLRNNCFREKKDRDLLLMCSRSRTRRLPTIRSGRSRQSRVIWCHRHRGIGRLWRRLLLLMAVLVMVKAAPRQVLWPFDSPLQKIKLCLRVIEATRGPLEWQVAILRTLWQPHKIVLQGKPWCSSQCRTSTWNREERWSSEKAKEMKGGTTASVVVSHSTLNIY